MPLAHINCFVYGYKRVLVGATLRITLQEQFISLGSSSRARAAPALEGIVKPNEAEAGLFNSVIANYSSQRPMQMPVHLVKLTMPTHVGQPASHPPGPADANC